MTIPDFKNQCQLSLMAGMGVFFRITCRGLQDEWQKIVYLPQTYKANIIYVLSCSSLVELDR